jgi:hypothetical protein
MGRTFFGPFCRHIFSGFFCTLLGFGGIFARLTTLAWTVQLALSSRLLRGLGSVLFPDFVRIDTNILLGI